MSPQRSPHIVATVLVHNNPWSAVRVLKALRGQTFAVDEIVFVDNGSRVPLTDEFKTAEIVLRPNEHVLRSDTNRGVGGGHNFGIDFARSMNPERIWILEHDTFVDPDCLEVLLYVSGRDETVVAAPSAARNEYERALADKEPAEPSSGLVSTDQGHALTFNGVLIHSSLLDRIGAVREDLQVGLEDRDFARRVGAAGGRLVRPTRMLMIHPTRGNNRFREPVAPERLYYSVRNAFLEQREHGSRPSLPRVARAVGAAANDVIGRDFDAAGARVRGLHDGLRRPIVPSRIGATGCVRVDVVSAPGAVDTMRHQPHLTCRACGEQAWTAVFPVASWRSLPVRANFTYGECAVCGSLTLFDDADPSQFYNSSYSPLRPRRSLRPDGRHLLAGRVGRALAHNPMTAAVSVLDRHASSWYTWFRGSKLTADTPILDVGCGSGAMLAHLRSFGFTNLKGIDPFLVSETSETGMRLRRAELVDIPAVPQFGLILFNHSLEHVDGPLDALSAACSRLLDEGRIVVRVPIVGGEAWRRYRDNFWPLDAPLHRFVPSPDGVQRLARRAGAQVIRWRGESMPWHYLASEAIRRGVNPEIVSPRMILDSRQQHWADRAARHARGAESGQATFVIRPNR